jgi:hypothetical protein
MLEAILASCANSAHGNLYLFFTVQRQRGSPPTHSLHTKLFALNPGKNSSWGI